MQTKYIFQICENQRTGSMHEVSVALFVRSAMEIHYVEILMAIGTDSGKIRRERVGESSRRKYIEYTIDIKYFICAVD